MNGGEFKSGLPSLGTYAGLVRACGRVRRPGPTRELALRLQAILTPPPLADMHVRMLNSWSPGGVSWPGKVVADVRLGLGHASQVVAWVVVSRVLRGRGRQRRSRR